MSKLKLLLAVGFASFACALFGQQLSSDSTQLFLDDNGELTQIRTQPEDLKNSVITLNPRIDDVVWKKTVLKVIDLREMQNQPLYYPVEDLDVSSPKNLFSIIFSNVLDGKLPAYKSQINYDQTFVPAFTPENQFDIESWLTSAGLDYNYTDTWSRVNAINRGVVKIYAKIVYYFNKSSSKFDSKILALGPLYDERYNPALSDQLHTSVFFWVPFEKLRPFLLEEYMKQNGRNTVSTVSFDEFFMRTYYDSYIIKDYDVTSQDVDRGLEDPRFIRQEQQRIENEILDFEQDLWAY